MKVQASKVARKIVRQQAEWGWDTITHNLCCFGYGWQKPHSWNQVQRFKQQINIAKLKSNKRFN